MPRPRVWVFLLVVVLSLFLFSPPVFSQQSSRYIVVFKNQYESRASEIIREAGGTSGKRLKLIHAQAAQLPSQVLRRLRADPRVLRVDDDVVVTALQETTRPVTTKDICDWIPTWPGCSPTPTPTPTPSSEPTATPIPTATPTPTPTEPLPTATPTPTPEAAASAQPVPWNITRIHAPEAWPTSLGLGAKVAVIDTGIDRDHPDLKGNLVGCVNFIQSWKTCEDDNGHGTHVAGIIAAQNNNLGVVGVAPQARLYALKVLDRRGSGYLSDIIEALDWSAANGVGVINMSLGTTSNVQSFHDAIIRVAGRGITQVAAAGNSGPDATTVTYPAKYPEVVAVAATDSSNNVASWSSRGPEVDLAAPGVSITSTYRGNGYRVLSGTSMASPHVAGVVALRLALHPGQSPQSIESLLEATADILPFDPTLVGAGLVNALAVVTGP